MQLQSSMNNGCPGKLSAVCLEDPMQTFCQYAVSVFAVYPHYSYSTEHSLTAAPIYHFDRSGYYLILTWSKPFSL